MTNRREFLIAAGALVMTAAMPVRARAARQDLASDIAILKQAYTAMHPGLQRYLTPMELDQGFSTLQRAWAANPSRADAYLSLSRFLSTIRCGHSYANFYNQSDEVVSELFSGRNRLPFHFRWIGGEMVVTANGTEALKRGTVIRTIDGEPTSAILASLLPYTRADGANNAKRVSQLDVLGIDRFEPFDIFYGLTRKRDSRPFRLATDRGDHVVDAIDLRQRQAQIPAQVEDDGPVWQVQDEGRGVTRLIMPGWALYNTKWNWKGWLDGVFADLTTKQVRTLIVDLRGNEVVSTAVTKSSPGSSTSRLPEQHTSVASDIERHPSTSIPISIHGMRHSRTGARTPSISEAGFTGCWNPERIRVRRSCPRGHDSGGSSSSSSIHPTVRPRSNSQAWSSQTGWVCL